MAGEVSTWQNRIVRFVPEYPVEELLAHPENWRIHPRHQQEALELVMDKVGVVVPVLVNERTGFLVDGHARVTVAMRKGITHLPAVVIDCDAGEERTILASLDSITTMAVADKDLLAPLLQSMRLSDMTLAPLAESVAAKFGVMELVEFPPLAPVEGVQASKDQHTIRIEVKAVDKFSEVLDAVRQLLEAHEGWNARIIA